ncbi:hypothetical protein H2204_003631 [Knufia peltigerae]|uniref:FAD dependent oxidoreductase domain-containing protein n=1 Tax=Knufia peltigerae TaxID=1002370 RepID=A0AA38Y950_9EURO|nr:hypothetical protein H2204_003631 [Knufia peltigerae]
MPSSSHAQPPHIQRLVQKIQRDPGLPVENATTPFWLEPVVQHAHHQSPSLSQTADVVILGSGITGISTALHLSRIAPELKIVMLEARDLTSGATGRNGGHIKAVPWKDYGDIKQTLGRESAIKITRFRLAHLPALLSEAASLGESGKAGLVRQLETLIACYDRDVWTQDKKKLKEFLDDMPEEQGKWNVHEDPSDLKKLGLAENCVGCISGRAGAAWPYRFLGAVTSKLLQKGAISLETHTPALSISEHQASSPYPYCVRTGRGSIQTKHVVHCTNGFVAHLIPGLRGKVCPLRGQMTVQSVPDDFPRYGAKHSWSAIWDRGFDYICQSPAADGSLYFGGGAFRSGLENDQEIGNVDDSRLSPQCLSHLETAAGKAFLGGEGARISKKWTGIMGFTMDGLPIVGRASRHVSMRDECRADQGGEWVAAGFNGYGMVHSWLSGKALAFLILGRDSEVRGWFPVEEFACSQGRLARMSATEFLGHFGGGVSPESHSPLSSKL